MIVVDRARIERAPRRGFAWRLSARVRYPEGGEEEYWIDGPGDPDGVDRSGTPWLVALAPLAVTLGETLRVEGGVDPVVRHGVQRVARTWRRWYPDLSPLALEAGSAPATAGERTGAMFSGGVDSLYTALSHRDELEDLLTVLGFDIPLVEEASFERMVERFRRLAAHWGVAVQPYATNLRETRWARAEWGALAHGCALAAVGLARGRRYRTIFIAATGGDRDPHPWGSHAGTDPLLSSSGTRFVHDGGEATRTDKLRALVSEQAALDVLRVCWRSGTEVNCGACSKCLRTMAALELLGALPHAPGFPPRLPPEDLERVRVWESWDVREFRDLAALAAASGRADLERAARRAMRRSARRRRSLRALEVLARRAPFRRPVQRLRGRLMADWIW